MIKKPHQNGTHANTPFSPGKSTGNARKVKYTTNGRTSNLLPTKHAASKNFSFRVQRLSYNPRKNSPTATAKVNAGNPQVPRFRNTGPSTVAANPCPSSHTGR